MKNGKERISAASAARKSWGITGKLVVAIIGSVVLALAVLLAIVYIQMSHALLEKSEDLIQATTEEAIQETRAWMNKTMTSLELQRDTIQYEDMDIPAMKAYIKHTVDPNSAYPAGLYVATTDGELHHASFIPGADYDPLLKAWYREGLQSEDFTLGNVYLDENSQSYVVAVSGVLKSRGGAVRGVAAADLYLDSISKIVSGIQLEKTGGIFLVDTLTDTIIGHQDPAMTGKNLNHIGSEMYDYAAEQIRGGKTGLSVYDNTYIQIADVPGSNWKAVAYVSRSEVLQELYELAVAILVLAALAVSAMLLLIIIQVRRVIGRPVTELSRVATQIAEGELNQEIHYQSNDELGVLANNFNQVTVRLRDYVRYIDEISRTLYEIAEGNLAFSLENDYTGEFAKIKRSLDEISSALNGTMGQLRSASRDVAAGAELVSSGAITLSQGSTEQSAEVDTLASHIDSVSDSIHKVAQGAREADRIAHSVKEGLLGSNDKMKNLTEVIQKISDNSTEINKIVKTIEDIAFQTNILALNAAVEASRAGEAGKGFAVVADEVRRLAGKSSEAAQETTILLGQTVKSMNEGVHAAQNTSDAILTVVTQADNMSNLVSGIAEYTKQQAANTEEITHGIEQIASVVQSNASTAEASAAASEELSSQATMLREMVAKFKLKETANIS